MTYRKCSLMKRTLLMLAMLALAACNTPARIPAPDSDTVDSGKRALEELARLPPAMERVRVGDTLRIVRDAGEMPTLSAFNVATIYELTLYTVLNDGSIYYPFIGRIQAAHRTPQEIANELTTKLAPIYREPRVTVNINQAPGNTVFVGGAVRNPSAVPIPAANNMEQAILGAGGILPVGDARRVLANRPPPEGLWKRTKFYVKKAIGAVFDGIRVTLETFGVIEETTAVERLAKDLEKKFEVTHAAGSTVMEISFTWSEPEVAQEVVKAWIEIYMEERTQALGRKSLYAFYEAQTADSAAQIKSYKAQILKHLNEIGASSIEDRLQDLSERINVLRGERFNSIRLIASSDSALESTRQQLKGLPREIVTVRQIALNPAQQDLRRLLNQKRLERADMMRTYTDDAPPVKALDASIRALEKEVQDEGATVQSSEDRAPNTLTTHLERVLLDETSNNAALRTQLAEQEKQLAELEAQRREALDIEPTLARLQRELNATERNYALYVDSLEKSRIDRELDKSQISNISVIEEATYNPGRIFPKTLLMLFLAVPFGLAVGLLVVYLCYLLDQRIHDGGLVEEKFGLPLWTTLPELSNSTAESSNAFTASIYRLYGLLPYARIEEKGLTLGLTSARHGEGVTFIIEQLRRLLEENGVRVRIGGEPAQPGEVVLLDAPALLDSREAFIALRRADLIALVVEAQKSTVPVVEHALTILTTAFGKVDGIIINRRRFEVPSKVLQTIARYRSAF